jgi:hypothetical protein
MTMKKRIIQLLEWPHHAWRSVFGTTRRKHDPFLVYNMAAFNFEGGWRQLLLKHHVQITWPEA